MLDNKNHTSVGTDTLNESVINDTNKALLFDINGIDEDKFVNTMFAKRLNCHLRCQAELNCENYKKMEVSNVF